MPAPQWTYDTSYDSSYADYNDDARSMRSERSTRQKPRVQTSVREISDDRIDFIRQRELAAFYGDTGKSLVLRKNDPEDESDDNNNNSNSNDSRNSRQLVRRQRDTSLPSGNSRRNGDGQQSRQDDANNADASSQRSRRSGRARSEQPRGQQQNQQQLARVQQDNGAKQPSSPQVCSPLNPRGRIPLNKDRLEKGQLAARIRHKKDGNFVERHFDSSWDGVIAAAAGAAIGAITARRFVEPETSEEMSQEKSRKNRMKIIGGAVAGAAAFNMGENHFRVWAEEHEEGGEWANLIGEGCCEGLDNFPIV